MTEDQDQEFEHAHCIGCGMETDGDSICDDCHAHCDAMDADAASCALD